MSLFITFEGIEGCGKSTQAARLAAYFESKGVAALLTHEPGDTVVTHWIRAVLADPASDLDNRAELLLFLADRAQHVARTIKPALENGTAVICDRYSDSTMAYQGYGRGHDLERLQTLDTWASQGTAPDLTLWIDTDIETGLRRARARGGADGDRFESQPFDFHRRIHDGFAALHERHPERIQRIDGNRDIEAVAADIVSIVEARLV